MNKWMPTYIDDNYEEFSASTYNSEWRNDANCYNCPYCGTTFWVKHGKRTRCNGCGRYAEVWGNWLGMSKGLRSIRSGRCPTCGRR